MGTKSAWTPERRAKQAERCREGKPWERSTGPRTKEGKDRSAQNVRRLTPLERYAQMVFADSRRAIQIMLCVQRRNNKYTYSDRPVRKRRYTLEELDKNERRLEALLALPPIVTMKPPVPNFDDYKPPDFRDF